VNIQEIFNLGIACGIKADPRGKQGVNRWLDLQKKKFDKLGKDEKVFFDTESLTNPYADSRIHFQNNKKVKTVLAGIDVEVGEIALVKALNKNIDLIITHHPEGKALVNLDIIMNMQADMLASYGVPINVAEGVMRDRIQSIARRVSPENHFRSIDAAKMADIQMMNMHTPCDNLVWNFLEKLMTNPKTGKKPETVGEIIEILKQVPEYKKAAIEGAGPMIFAGSPENRCGKIAAFDITGGTSGSKEIYPELVKAGIGTVIGMHMSEENREEAVKNHLNIVIAGHISSDSLGMNLFLDELEKKGIEVIPISGLTRIKRIK
jgi:putative NIF3 family GTP cyclohydrolase 1 type 2